MNCPYCQSPLVKDNFKDNFTLNSVKRYYCPTNDNEHRFQVELPNIFYLRVGSSEIVNDNYFGFYIVNDTFVESLSPFDWKDSWNYLQKYLKLMAFS